MKKVFLIVAVLFVAKLHSQQDPQYSLYQFNQLVINPGYAGARDAIAIVADVRKQWAGIEGSPGTAALSVHSPVLNNKLGVGLNIVSDRLGAKASSGVYANIAYILKIGNKSKLAFGARAGYAMYKFNFSEVKYKDANETAYTELNNTNRGALDVDAGLYFRTHTFFAGISATHLNKGVLYNGNFQSADPVTGAPNDYSLSFVLNPHLFFTIGNSFVINENFLIAPSVMVKNVKGKTTADINLNFFISKRFWAGVYLRQGYGFGALFQAYVTNQFRIGYAYDTGLGKKRNLGGGHEIMLGFDIRKSQAKIVSPRLL